MQLGSPCISSKCWWESISFLSQSQCPKSYKGPLLSIKSRRHYPSRKNKNQDTCQLCSFLMTCCRYLKYKPCRIPLTESKLSESREPWILVCSQPRLPLPPTQSGQNKFTLKLFFCTELILLKRKTVTFLALTGAQEMRISIRLSWSYFVIQRA